jgi:hypothetical protein
MNGYDFAERVLGQTNYDVLPLINFAGGGETEWLEFKAAMLPKDGIYGFSGKKQDNKWDHFWDISKALIGLANHIGGVLLLGVNEGKHEGKPTVEIVSLEHSGFMGDRDQFMRNNVRPQLISPDGGWKTATSGTWICETLHAVVTPRWGHLFGQPVLVLLVHPRTMQDGWLRATQRNGAIEKNAAPCRARGDFGRTDMRTEEEVEDWWSSRESYRTDLELGYQSFLDQWTGSTKRPDAQTNSIIEQNLLLLLAESKDFEGVFSPGTAGDGALGSHFLAEADEFDDTPAEGRSRKTSPQSVQKLLHSNPRTVLLGEPGSGKSTCFRFAATRLAESWEPGKPWGLLVNLNEFGDSGLRATILRKLESLHWIDIEGRLASGELILFLDALNECPVGRYVECCQDIAALLKFYPRARVHITSRVTHNPSQFKLPAFQIRPMSRDQRLKFLAIYLGNSARADEVLSHLDQQPGAEHFSGSPILLRIVAGIAQEPGTTLPTGMANLYRQFLQKWFKRELDKNLVTGTPALWSFGGFVEALSLLAFRMRRDGLVSCSIEFARQSVAPVIGVDHLARFLDQMAQGLLLKKNRQDDYLQFSHQTIQEYFAAEYLASHPDVLRETLDIAGATESSSGWFLTLVLAFELIERPTRDFLDAAWVAEPLLVAVALRSDEQLLRLPIHRHSDLWLRGILRAMRGEDATAEIRELAFFSRLPPKYPLPASLTNSLRSAAFWYAGESHQIGRLRLDRLRKFLLDRNSMWIETMPYLAEVDSSIAQRLSPAQKMIADIHADSTVLDAINLREATVIELCTLLRYKKMSNTQFATHWRDALGAANAVHRETNLLAVIRTAKEFKGGTVRVNLRDLDQPHWEALSQLGQHWKLSLRLLNFLVREGFVNVHSLRTDPGRIVDIVERLSPMNMYRFLKARIIDRGDIPITRLRSLIGELKPSLTQELIHARLLVSADMAGGRFSVSELEHSDRRKQIEVELVTKDWDVTVSKVLSSDTFGFVSHPGLSDGAIVHFDRISNPNGRTIRLGDKLRVRLNVQFDSKKNRWGFAVKSGKIFIG